MNGQYEMEGTNLVTKCCDGVASVCHSTLKVLWRFVSIVHGEQSVTTTGEHTKLKWPVDS